MYALGDKPMSEYHVTAFWDDEAKVWVGTSEDVPGLCVESATLEELLQTVGELMPELLILNGVLPQGAINPVHFRVISESMARKVGENLNSISLCG
jgi:predicted RNase H-like HicB family nuclease